MIDRDNDHDPPFYRRGLLVRPDGSAVDHLDVAVIGDRDRIHHTIPKPGLPPSYKAVVAGGSRAIAFGQIAPRRTGSQHPKDAVQHSAGIDTRHASRLVGQERLDDAPLEVSQVVSAHPDVESDMRPAGKISRRKRRLNQRKSDDAMPTKLGFLIASDPTENLALTIGYARQIHICKVDRLLTSISVIGGSPVYIHKRVHRVDLLRS